MSVNKLTPYVEVNALLDELSTGMQRCLGDNLVGLYLFGSLTTGDFNLGTSDLDLLAATQADLNQAEYESLLSMHQAFAQAHPQWSDRVEVAYLSCRGLQTYHSQSSQLAIISPGEPFHLKQAGKDWLINWYVVRTHGIRLYGPAPQEIIEPASLSEYLQAVRENMLRLSALTPPPAHRGAQAYRILTMCRALCTIEAGKIVSKQEAASWAEQKFPEWAHLVRQALVWRTTHTSKPLDSAIQSEIQRFSRFIAAQCHPL